MPHILYKLNDLVPKTSNYVCIICGYVKEFKEGEKFGVCPDCLAGEENGPIPLEEGFWKLVG